MWLPWDLVALIAVTVVVALAGAWLPVIWAHARGVGVMPWVAGAFVLGPLNIAVYGAMRLAERRGKQLPEWLRVFGWKTNVPLPKWVRAALPVGVVGFVLGQVTTDSGGVWVAVGAAVIALMIGCVVASQVWLYKHRVTDADTQRV